MTKKYTNVKVTKHEKINIEINLKDYAGNLIIEYDGATQLVSLFETSSGKFECSKSDVLVIAQAILDNIK